ncbi:ABC transporter ATP-binding protein [Treponema primitia]|uniref:ABC transporter ATP-binding protein n=1 Tax=Treponema primitia TaxID=88058 RepID=UPI0002555473|nr:ABC transporter ATP-binding protein [Treponema primitia]
MLRISNLNAFYDNIHALKDISLEIQQGEIVSLIGSNGAGKTSTLGCITGLVPARSGDISYKDRPITNMPVHKIVDRGISLSPEGREVFPGLTVEENLRLGMYSKKNSAAKIHEAFQRVYGLFPRLKERVAQVAGTLSGGEQQMLAIGRALMSEPELLLLDEPSLGLAPNLVLMIFELIKEINKQGVTILLVEQNANMALSISNRAYVLETGRIALSGESHKLMNDENIRKAYLGNI